MANIDNRKVHLDLLRIIACFCVILIHCCIYGQSSGWSNQDASLLITNFYGILSRWAVPCFVMISGMMFLNINKEIPLKKLYTKYILRLFISYVFWSCVYSAYNCFYEVSGGLKEKLQYIINNCFSGEIHMWYVLMIIGMYIAIPVIKYLVNNLPKNIIINLSKLTYGIYLIHVLILKVLYHIGINVSICNVAISEPLVSLITFIVSVIIIFVISKIPVVNKYIC